jgi:3D (Asp-Asp-Asp) domain-containing protein
MKKAQITIFLIVGLFLLISLGFIFYFSGKTKIENKYSTLDIAKEKIQFASKTQDCIEIQTKEAIDLYGLNIPESEEKISEYIENNLQTCANPDLWRNLGLIVEEDRIRTNTEISGNWLFLKVNYPVKLQKEDISVEISDYSYNVRIKENKTMPVDRYGYLITDTLLELKELGAKLEIGKLTYVKDLSNLKKGDESLPNSEKISFEARGSDIVNNMDTPVTNLIYDFGLNDTWFYPAARLTLSYENIVVDVPPNDLRIVYYDSFLEEWIELKTDVDLRAKTLSADVYHFTPYAIGIESEIKEELNKYENQQAGINEATGNAIDEISGPNELQIEDIKNIIKEEFGDDTCYESNSIDVECTVYKCNYLLKGFPTELCYHFNKAEQYCPGDKILVPWHCPKDESVRCCVRPEVFNRVKELSVQYNIPSVQTFGIVTAYDMMSDENKIDYILSRIEDGNFLDLPKDELFMLSIMSADIIKKIAVNKEQDTYDRNKLIRLAQAVKLIKHYLVKTESQEKSIGEIGSADIISANVTKYYTSYEGDFKINNVVNWEAFRNDVILQGSGVGINKDRIYRHDSITKTKETSQYILCSGVSCNGITASGTHPMEEKTLAVPPEIPLGTQIYVDYGAGHKELSQCYVAEDRGGAIKTKIDPITGKKIYHIDVYVGVGKEKLKKTYIPENAHITIGC